MAQVIIKSVNEYNDHNEGEADLAELITLIECYARDDTDAYDYLCEFLDAHCRFASHVVCGDNDGIWEDVIARLRAGKKVKIGSELVDVIIKRKK